MAKSIFVSYSHQDDVWCRQMVAILRAVGYDVWHDETGLKGGDAWVASIQREIQAREIFLLILTPEAWASEWVQEEFQLAKIARRRIITVLLRETQVDGFVLTTQWVKVVGEEPQAASRSIIPAIESAPAPGRSAAPQSTETLDQLVTLCQSLASENRHTEALSACDRALAIDPNNFDALRIKGNVLAQIGQQARAAAAFGQALLHLNLSSAHRYTELELNALRNMIKNVFTWSEDPATILQLYRFTVRNDVKTRLNSQFSGFDSMDELFTIIERLSALGAKHAIEEVVSQYELGGTYSPQFLNALTHSMRSFGYSQELRVLADTGLINLTLQFGAHAHVEEDAVKALVSAGHIDAAMRQAPQLTDLDDRKWMLHMLKEQGRFGEVDYLCRHWFGSPPPSRWLGSLPKDWPYATDSDGTYERDRMLELWVEALQQLGRYDDAKAVGQFIRYPSR